MSLPKRTWMPLGRLGEALLDAGEAELASLGLYLERSAPEVTTESPCLIVDLGPTEDEERHPVVDAEGARFVLGRSEIEQVVRGTKRVLGASTTGSQIAEAIAHYIEHDSFLFVGQSEAGTPEAVPEGDTQAVEDLVSRLVGGDLAGVCAEGKSPWLEEDELRALLGGGVRLPVDVLLSSLKPAPLEGGGYTFDVPLVRADGCSLVLAVDVERGQVTIGSLDVGV